jgi:hypothetical protein
MNRMEKRSEAGAVFLLQLFLGCLFLHGIVLDFFKWLVS